MTDATRAAALWATIEEALLRRGLLHDGRDLREQRAALVRAIGDAIGGGVAPLKPIEPDVSYPAAMPEHIVRGRPRRMQVRHMVERTPADSDVSRMLDRFLDASCRAGGYSGDDEVEYS